MHVDMKSSPPASASASAPRSYVVIVALAFALLFGSFFGIQNQLT